MFNYILLKKTPHPIKSALMMDIKVEQEIDIGSEEEQVWQ